VSEGAPVAPVPRRRVPQDAEPDNLESLQVAAELLVGASGTARDFGGEGLRVDDDGIHLLRQERMPNFLDDLIGSLLGELDALLKGRVERVPGRLHRSSSSQPPPPRAGLSLQHGGVSLGQSEQLLLQPVGPGPLAVS
jgi:hypothetical protein